MKIILQPPEIGREMLDLLSSSRRNRVQSGQFSKRIENEFDKLLLSHNPVLS